MKTQTTSFNRREFILNLAKAAAFITCYVKVGANGFTINSTDSDEDIVRRKVVNYFGQILPYDGRDKILTNLQRAYFEPSNRQPFPNVCWFSMPFAIKKVIIDSMQTCFGYYTKLDDYLYSDSESVPRYIKEISLPELLTLMDRETSNRFSVIPFPCSAPFTIDEMVTCLRNNRLAGSVSSLLADYRNTMFSWGYKPDNHELCFVRFVNVSKNSSELHKSESQRLLYGFIPKKDIGKEKVRQSAVISESRLTENALSFYKIISGEANNG